MSTTHFIWDELSDNILLESDGLGETQVEYTNTPELYGEPVSQQRNQSSIFHYDGEGNATSLSDPGESIVEQATYSAFGEVVSKTTTITNPFGYKGRFGFYENPVHADYYARARTFNATTARWLSPDPIGFVGGTNLYMFVSNNPVTLADPTGLYQIRVQVDAFIPQAWVRVDPWSHVKGDDRTISDTPLGPESSRAFSIVDLEMEECVREEPIVPESDFSTISDSTLRTRAGSARRLRFITKRGTMTATINAARTGSCSVVVDLRMRATLPWELVPFAPAIDWEMKFDLHAFEVVGRGVVVTGTQNGQHDGFPAYEAYVQSRRVYSHDPIATGQTPFSLFPPMEFEVRDNGIAFRDPAGVATCCECRGTYEEWAESRRQWSYDG